MCGITGAFSTNLIRQESIDAATNSLAHRGPNASGSYKDEYGKFVLGHRRLSILDLSDTANQPMYSTCGRYVMVYNGEVYNFNELRARLPGFSWKTTSDSEVILELFASSGVAFLSWLNGMFSIAIYDTVERKVLIARDQVGIKPLFYYYHDSLLVFASELKAIRAYLREENRPMPINRSSVPGFLHLGFIAEPDTIYQHTYKFPAGYYGTVSEENPCLTLTRYWNPADFFLTDPIRDTVKALGEYKELLFSSISDQMVSDVPLGTFLSGGIDSSLVTAVAAQLSSRKVNTFSIGFNEAQYDESMHASAVASHLGTEHHTFKVSADEVLELVPHLMEIYDEPFADSSAFPTMLVSKLAKQHVTVALSGDGGDELFQGYGMYTWASRLANPFVKAIRKPLYYSGQWMNNRYRRASNLFNYPSSSHIPTHIFSQEQSYFSEQELSALLIQNDFNFDDINTIKHAGNANAAEKQALWDFEHYLKDDLLVKVDRAGMFYSLETRVPLLDTRLVEFSLNLDYNLKVNKQHGSKYLMKKVLYELVPRKLFERPKRGFAIPLQEWLKGPLFWMIDRYLTKGVVDKHGFVHFKQVKDLLSRFQSGQDHLYNRIWILVVLHWWLEKQSETC